MRKMPKLLENGLLAEAGKLLTESHLSSQRYFQNSALELDFLVEPLVPLPGIHGARLTGGGFGEAVLALTGPEFTPAAADLVRALYAKRYDATPEIFQFKCGAGADVLQAKRGTTFAAPALMVRRD